MATRDRPGPVPASRAAAREWRLFADPRSGRCAPWLWEALGRDRLLTERRAGQGRLSSLSPRAASEGVGSSEGMSISQGVGSRPGAGQRPPQQKGRCNGRRP